MSELPVLEFYPDGGAESPFWDRHGAMVTTKSLPLPDALRVDIDAWARDAYWDSEKPGVVEQGLRLFEAARIALKGKYEVRLDDDWFDEET
jgi:hypothetical protein